MFDQVGIRVAPVTPALAAQVRALRVAPGQEAFVGDTAFNLTDAQRNPRSEAMAILVDGAHTAGEEARVIGFYRLDPASMLISRSPIAAGIGLRALVIDRDQQGRGWGTRALAACCADLRHRHPQYRLLALNVDCANHGAIGAYRKAGFVDSGELYAGGRGGPQRLMLRSLDAPAWPEPRVG